MPEQLQDRTMQAEQIARKMEQVFNDCGLLIDLPHLQKIIEEQLNKDEWLKEVFSDEIMYKFDRDVGLKPIIEDFEKFADKIKMDKEKARARKALLGILEVRCAHFANRFFFGTDVSSNNLTFGNVNFDRDPTIYQNALSQGELNEYKIKGQFNFAEGDIYLEKKMKEKMKMAYENKDTKEGLTRLATDIKQVVKKIKKKG